ncbi:MAG: 50S ribosomal protein L6, partial [Chitinispirillaceae bacterium]|nr:50S ribosomal protein L6 [Chitinispirillaceae bacterium]
MSRIGKLPVKIPTGVSVKVDGHKVEIKGPKGTLMREVNREISVAVEGDKILLRPAMEGDNVKSLWGLNRVLLFNMVEGVTQGYKKELEIVGVGYKAEVKGKDLVLSVGMSTPYK